MDEEKKRFIERGSHKGKGIAVFTSGGDSQGKKEQFSFIYEICNTLYVWWPKAGVPNLFSLEAH